MPSQRSKTKTIVGGYFEAELKVALLAQARREGRTMTDLIHDYLWAGLNAQPKAKRGAQHPARLTKLAQGCAKLTKVAHSKSK